MSKFSFRRSDTMAFKHIAHGFIPAATIAPRPAVPRTPPPRSPYPSPERPRSALAAAILSTTLTGRTVALPPTRQRSYSESDCSYNETRSAIEPYASTAEFRREQWNESLASRPRLPSPACSDDDDEEEDVEEEVQSDPDEGHVYSSIVRESRSPGQDAVYAVPLKKKANLMSESSDMTDSSDFGLLSASESDPKPIQENIQAQTVETQKAAVPRKEQKERTPRITPSPDLADDLSVESPKNHPKKKTVSKKSIRKGSRSDLTDEAFKEVLTMHKERLEELKERNQALVTERQALMQQCDDQSRCLKESQLRVEELERHNRRLLAATERSPRRGEVAELISLRQQAQELVDENDGLKVTVHRLNVELSRYQTKFRPLSKQESSRINGLPLKGPPPPWLLDMKYLSPLFLAYEDRLNEKDVLLKACEEELKNFRVRVEEVVMENGQLHQELRRSSSVNHREWRQLQDQAKLVLEENQVLMEQLEVQQAKAKDSHNRHIHEVSKVTKQLMLLESEKQSLEEELSETRRQLHTLQAHTSLDSMVSREEYTSAVNKLRRKLQQEEEKKKAECEELLSVVASLEAEKKAWLLEKANLAAQNQTMEAEIEILRKGHRKAQRKIGLLTQQVEDALDKEVAAHQYLASIINLAERTTHERDQLINMIHNPSSALSVTGLHSGAGQAGGVKPDHRGHHAPGKTAGKGQGVQAESSSQPGSHGPPAAGAGGGLCREDRLLPARNPTPPEAAARQAGSSGPSAAAEKGSGR
ncbi:centrosomal protein of 89 kDa isoform X2 [Amia ocellicauda]|uniref:centrosomal protein of 89 kDa isoform X2 n=1 Tax=Amia ocellicauda TaxID=2972642 RepID=UPI0034649A9D